jgi:ATP-binding cassette subfamily B protein
MAETPRAGARWRALFRLLWRAGRWRLPPLAGLVLLTGLLPTAVILATGALVRAVPAAARHGLGAPEGRPAVLALAALAAAMALLALAGNALGQLGAVLDAEYALEVHHTVALAMLAPPGLAPLEDPAFADRVHAVQEADRRGVLRRGVRELATFVATRLGGLGAFAVLLAFRWWAPFLLAAAWHLTNRVFARATENGVTVDMGDGSAKLRRSEYLRSLAVEAPAAKELRVFGLGAWLVDRYGEVWQEALGAMWQSRRSGRALTAATTAALALSHAVVFGAIGLAAARGELGVAAVLVFAQAVLATADLGLVGDSQWWLSQTLAVAERADGLRAAAAAIPDESGGGAAARGKVAVRLDGVRFTYAGRREPTLDGLSLEVPPGQSLAIVGENGAGKSTLVKLLCGFYDPDAGTVTLDGGASPLEARGRVGVIFQDFVRYPLPLRENVGLGHLPLIGDGRALEGALADAGGAGLLERLPHGWDTVLSREFEGGADLSGGEWQRVALARALAAVRGGAGLLIMDEPTASLDVRAETELFERFLELTKDVTTILVSHRLSSVRRADRIVVIHGGRVVEDGTHDALMAAGGRYAGMFSLQAERFAAEADGAADGVGAAGGEVAHA